MLELDSSFGSVFSWQSNFCPRCSTSTDNRRFGNGVLLTRLSCQINPQFANYNFEWHKCQFNMFVLDILHVGPSLQWKRKEQELKWQNREWLGLKWCGGRRRRLERRGGYRDGQNGSLVSYLLLTYQFFQPLLALINYLHVY